MYYCYRHIRLDKDEPFYIGMGTKVVNAHTFKGEYKRAFDRSKSKRTNHWCNIAKTGYIVEIIYESDDRDEISEKEKEFITLYGLKGEGGVLVNLTYGGEGGWKLSEETRKNASKRMMGNSISAEARKKIGDALRGKSLSDAHKQKLRDIKKGIPLSDAHKQKLSIIQKNRVNLKDIMKSLKEGNRRNSPNSKRVYCFQTELIYNSVANCVRELFGIDTESSRDPAFTVIVNRIRRICRGESKEYKGYTFKFI